MIYGRFCKCSQSLAQTVMEKWIATVLFILCRTTMVRRILPVVTPGHGECQLSSYPSLSPFSLAVPSSYCSLLLLSSGDSALHLTVTKTTVRTLSIPITIKFYSSLLLPQPWTFFVFLHCLKFLLNMLKIFPSFSNSALTTRMVGRISWPTYPM